MCRYCCKSLFALLIKNSRGSRCDFGINMCGTSSHSDELTGDFGNKPEAILIGDHGLSCLLAEKLSLRDLRLLQQYLPKQTFEVRFTPDRPLFGGLRGASAFRGPLLAGCTRGEERNHGAGERTGGEEIQTCLETARRRPHRG